MSKKFTVDSLANKIKADNEKFEQATKAEKRVMIAQDCLVRINMKQIKPLFGSFCKLKTNSHSETSIKDVLEKERLVCTSCAKGSLFIAYLGRVNNFTVEDLHDNNSNSGYDESHLKLLEIFTRKQLALIENFFEGKQFIYYEYNFDDRIIEKYREKIIGGYDHRTPEGADNLLRELCKNIIKNKGTFKLPKYKNLW